MSKGAGPRRTRPPSRRGTRARPTASPHDLIQRCLRGDEGAWDEFVAAYANLIHSTVLKFDLSRDDAAEAFQCSVVAIHRQLASLRNADRLVPWIIGISARQAVNHIRARTRHARALERRSQELVAEESATPLPDHVLLELERAQAVQEAFSQLSPRCRALLTRLFFDDPPSSYDEIARRERIPRGSIGPVRQRCLDQLRRLLTRNGWPT